MIEFSGYIYGTAQKYFFKKSRSLVIKIMLVSILILLPGIIVISFNTGLFILLGIYFATIAIVPLCVYIPRSKKEKKAMIPKRVLIEDEYIIAINDKHEDIKQIKDVKMVNDFDEFYEIVFPFGKISSNFICQKNLIFKGSLEEFEDLFNGKIVKRR